MTSFSILEKNANNLNDIEWKRINGKITMRLFCYEFKLSFHHLFISVFINLFINTLFTFSIINYFYSTYIIISINSDRNWKSA